MELDLTIQEPHFQIAMKLLDTKGGIEAAGYMWFGCSKIAADPWTKNPRLRLISHRIKPVSLQEQKSASPTHITWSTGGFMRLLGDAKRMGMVPAIIHTHPTGLAKFSDQDDRNEQELARTAAVKGVRGLLSIVLNGQGEFAARLWLPDGQRVDVPRIRRVGSVLENLMSSTLSKTSDPVFDRQRRLFGSVFNDDLSKLRIGVVGAGATGSATISLLFRLGVGKILALDKDIIDITNLNRVHGSRRSDVKNNLTKVEIADRTIIEADTGSQIVTIMSWAGAVNTRDALKSCDVIFCCTDDHAGRLFLNRLSRFYAVPLIDMGLRMTHRSDGELDVFGRVSTLVPGHSCLMCQKVINPERARAEALQRKDPELFRKLKDEAYVVGSSDPAPAVVTFTTEIAAVAVNELIASLTRFQGPHGMTSMRIRRFHAQDERFPEIKSSDECPLCRSERNLGRGDMDPFMDSVG